MLVMCAVVFATYLPVKPSEFPPDARPVLLGLDFLNLHIRRIRFVRETLFGEQRYLPGWYSRELGGTPFWSNLQNFPLIPTRLLLLMITPTPEDAFGIAVQIAANLSAIFMFLYCQKIGLGRVGSAVAGFTFACSGFFASRVFAGHLPLLEAYGALPLLLWIVEVNISSCRGRPAHADPPIEREGEARWTPGSAHPLKLLAAALAAFCVAVAGHPQIPVYAFTIAALYILFRAPNRRGLMTGAAMLLGIGAASFVLYPMLLLIGRSTRVLALDPPTNDLAFPYGRLAAFVLPDIDGRMPPDFHGYGEPTNPAYFWDTVCYLGVLPLIACVFFLARWIIIGRRPRGVWLFIALAGALALAFALPAWHGLMQKIPGTILRSPSRQIYITTFALAIAGGALIDCAIKYARSRGWTWAMLLIGVVIAAQVWDLGYRHDRKFVTALAVPKTPDASEAQSIIREVGLQRAAINYNIQNIYNRQVDDVGVFDSILLARPYRAVMEVCGALPRLNIQNIDGWQLNARALRFFGVKLMLTNIPPQDPRGLEEVSRGPGLILFAVPDPMARASLIQARRAEFMSDDEIHKHLLDQSFDLSQHLLLPTDTPKPSDAAPPTEMPKLDLKRPSSDVIQVDLVSPWPAYLRLLDVWDPGWRATVDGSPAPIARVYDTFMAIPISPGLHNVVLAYHTPGLTIGVILSIVSLAGLAGLCWMSRRGWASESSNISFPTQPPLG